MLTEWREMLAGLALTIAAAFGCDNGMADCNKPEPGARIRGCTVMIESGAFSSTNLAKAHINRAIAYEKMGDMGQAIKDYDRAVALDPKSADDYFNRGIYYANKGETDRSIKDFDKAIEFNPKDATAYYNRGVSYGQKGDYGQAIADYGRTIILDPNYTVALANRGAAYMRLGDIERAANDFDRAIEIDAKQATAFYNRAQINLINGDVESAVYDSYQAVALEPKNAKFLRVRCWALAVAGKSLDLARADCNASLALANDPNTLDNRGLVFLKQGQFDKAWADYDAALKARPGTASYLYGRGIAALRLGRTTEGNVDLAAATRLEGKIAETYAFYGVRP